MEASAPPVYHRHPAAGKITVGGQPITTAPQMLALVQSHVDEQFQQMVDATNDPARRRSRGDSLIGRNGKSPVICRHWMLGRCMFGAACRFNHGTAHTTTTVEESPCSVSLSSPDESPKQEVLPAPEGGEATETEHRFDAAIPPRERNDSLCTTATTPHPHMTPGGPSLPMPPHVEDRPRAKAGYLVIQTQEQPAVLSPQISPRAAGYAMYPATVPPSPQAFATLSPTAGMSVRVGSTVLAPLSPTSASVPYLALQKQPLSVRVGVPAPPSNPRPVVCAPVVILPACYLAQLPPSSLSRPSGAM